MLSWFLENRRALPTDHDEVLRITGDDPTNVQWSVHVHARANTFPERQSRKEPRLLLTYRLGKKTMATLHDLYGDPEEEGQWLACRFLPKRLPASLIVSAQPKGLNYTLWMSTI